MRSRLKRVRDWEAFAQANNYCATSLAEICEISPRQLERFFQRQFGKSPHQWLHDLRMRRACELLRDGTTAKETAFLLGYKTPSHFTHDFKKSFGAAPTLYDPDLILISFPTEMSRFDKRSRV